MSFHMLHGADGKKQLFCQQHTEPVGVSGHQHASRVEASGKVGLCKNQPCVPTQYRCKLHLGVHTSAYDFSAGHAQALNYNATTLFTSKWFIPLCKFHLVFFFN